MSYCDFLREEFDHEIASTRKVLAAVPEDKLTWQPHPKSMTMGRLAGHIAEIPRWACRILEHDAFDIMPGGNRAFQPFHPATREELLHSFEEYATRAHEAVKKINESQLGQPWSLLFSGKTVLTKNRYSAFRFLALNHLIHHRAQLTVYLRLTEVSVPGLYGPSADEKSS